MFSAPQVIGILTFTRLSMVATFVFSFLSLKITGSQPGRAGAPKLFYNRVVSRVGRLLSCRVPLTIHQTPGAPGGPTRLYNLFRLQNVFHRRP